MAEGREPDLASSTDYRTLLPQRPLSDEVRNTDSEFTISWRIKILQPERARQTVTAPSSPQGTTGSATSTPAGDSPAAPSAPAGGTSPQGTTAAPTTIPGNAAGANSGSQPAPKASENP